MAANSAMFQMLLSFSCYLLGILIIGIFAARHGRTISAYFLADRSLGAWVTAISSVASSESGWVVIGLVGEGYMWGFSAVWAVPGCLLGFLMNWYLIAPRLRRLAAEKGSITVPEFLGDMVGDRTHLVRIIGVLIIVLCLSGYVAAQFTACAKAFRGAFNIPYTYGVLLAGLITVFYTLLGGFRAVSWTDLLQGLLMVAGLVVLPILAIVHIGGVSPMMEGLKQEPARFSAIFEVTDAQGWHQIKVENEMMTFGGDPGHTFTLPSVAAGKTVLTISTEDGKVIANAAADAGISINGSTVSGRVELAGKELITLSGISLKFDKTYSMYGGEVLTDTFGKKSAAAAIGWVLGLLGISLGYPGQPHVLTRYMASRDDKTIRVGRVIAIVWGVLALYGAVVLGHAARLILPGIVDPEMAYPLIAVKLLHPLLAGIVLAAILSAMMSTADSQILVVASAIARDIFHKIFRPEADERTLVMVSRITVFLLGVVSIIVALKEVRVVFWFVLLAWSGLGSSFGPPLILSLYWKKLTRAGVVASMITGFAVTIIWKFKLKAVVQSSLGIGLYELVPAFLLSLLAAWLVSLMTYRPPRDEEEEDLP